MSAQIALKPSGFGTNDVRVMVGNFEEFTFVDLLQVLSLSRQCLRLMVLRGNAAFSEVLLKAGQVIDARLPDTSEPESVFRSLVALAIRGSGLSFAVYHTEPNGPFPTPRFTLRDLVDRIGVKAAIAAPPAVVPDTDPTLELPQTAPPRVQRDSVDPLAATMPLGRRPATETRAASAATAQPFAAAPSYAPAPGDVAPSPLTAEALGKLIADEVRPIVRDEVSRLLTQTHQQGQSLNQMDGRLMALPQLIAAEVRLALAQHTATLTPPPAAVSEPPRPLISAAALMSGLLGIVVVVLLGVLVWR